MFNKDELLEYESDFKRLGIEVSQDEMRLILDYMYSFGLMTYEYFNNGNKFCAQ